MDLVKLSNKKKSLVELARTISFQSQHKVFHHGAVLVKGSKVINTAFNTLDYSSFGDRFVTYEGFATRHAELRAVLGVGREMTQGAEVYVVRTNRKGDLMLSKPCEMCASAMRFVGIKRVYFSDEKGRIRAWKL